MVSEEEKVRSKDNELGQAGPSWAKLGLSWVQAGPSWASFYGNNEKRGKRKKEQKLSGENTPKSEIGKISYQNWKSEPKNSPKAFGELKNYLPGVLILFLQHIKSSGEIVFTVINQNFSITIN